MLQGKTRLFLLISAAALSLLALPLFEGRSHATDAEEDDVNIPGYPSKKLLDQTQKVDNVTIPRQFFYDFGRAVGTGYGGTDNLGRAKAVMSKLNETKEQYGLLVNYGAAILNPLYGEKFKCGWWRKSLDVAFSAAAIHENDLISADSSRYKGGKMCKIAAVVDPNLCHTAEGVIADKKIHMFDPWQSGFDSKRGPESGVAYLGDIASARYSGKPMRDWVSVQIEGGRPWLLFDSQDHFLSSTPPTVLCREATEKLNKGLQEKTIVQGLEFTDNKGIIAGPFSARVVAEVMDRAKESAGEKPIDLGNLKDLSLVEQVIVGKSSVNGDDLIDIFFEKKWIAYTMTLEIPVYQEIEGKKTANPIEDAIFKIMVRDNKSYELTDKGKGLYEIEFAGPGPFKVRIKAEGYKASDGKKELEAEIELPHPKRKGSTYTCEPLYLVPVYGAIQVKVENARDEAITGAAVQLYKDKEKYKGEMTTDEDGNVLYEECPPGEYYASVNAPYYEDGVTNTITVEKERYKDHMHFMVARLEPFTGTVNVSVVSGAAGSAEVPVEGATVTLSDAAEVDLRQTTDLKGTAVFTKVPPSLTTKYMFKAEKEGYAPAMKAGLKILPKTEGEVFGEKLVLVSGGKIEVRAVNGDTFKPIEGVSIQLSGPMNANVFTDTAGRATFEKLPFGVYYVGAALTGYGKPDDREAEIKDGAAMGRVNFSLYPGMRVKVLIKDKNKPTGEQLIPGSYASIDPNDTKFCPTGTYEFNLRGGKTYTIKAWARGYNQNSRDYVVPTVPEMDRDQVSILLKFGMSLTVEVRDERGGLLTGSNVTLSKGGRPIRSARGPAPTFSDLLEGSYSATVVANGYESGSRDITLSAAPGSPMNETAVITLQPLPPPPSAQEVLAERLRQEEMQRQQEESAKAAMQFIGAVIGAATDPSQQSAPQSSDGYTRTKTYTHSHGPNGRDL